MCLKRQFLVISYIQRKNDRQYIQESGFVTDSLRKYNADRYNINKKYFGSAKLGASLAKVCDFFD